MLEEINPLSNNAIRIGITGPPGAGKSTITNQLIKKYRQENKRVCALLVDPTSPFTNGAVLGDRIRMREFYKDEKVFIRSIASRGSKGGLSKNIDHIADILDFSGFDIIIFETVGVGQIELDVINSVDTVAVVLVPESGDDIQIMKAGLIEIADIYIINKYDRKDSNKIFLVLKNMLKLLSKDKWKPEIIKTIAKDNVGIKELYKAIKTHNIYLKKTGSINNKINDRYKRSIKNLIINDLEKQFWSDNRKKILSAEINKDSKDRLSQQELHVLLNKNEK